MRKCYITYYMPSRDEEKTTLGDLPERYERMGWLELCFYLRPQIKENCALKIMEVKFI